MTIVLLVARLVLACVFLVAGVAKLADVDGARRAARQLGLPARLAAAVAVVLPIVELAVAASLLPSVSARSGAIAAAILLLAFAAVIAVALARGRHAECHCFGKLQSESIGARTLIRNVALLAMAGAIVSTGAYGSELHLAAWAVSDDGVRVVAVLLVTPVLAVALAAFLDSEPGEHGRSRWARRVLARAGLVGAATKHNLALAHAAASLPLGSPAPQFDLADVQGERRTLTGLVGRGRPVLLVFVDPHCGPCHELLSELAAWQDVHRNRLSVVPISRGNPRANLLMARERALQDVLLQNDQEVANAYAVHATPGAVLVSREGQIASSVALGPAPVVLLLQRSVFGPAGIVQSDSMHLTQTRTLVSRRHVLRASFGIMAGLIAAPSAGARLLLAAQRRGRKSSPRARSSDACAKPLCWKLYKHMQISAAGLAFIRTNEGLCTRLYDDGSQHICGRGRGNCTIGVGHLVHVHPCCHGKKKKHGKTKCSKKDSDLEKKYLGGITRQKADELLREDLTKREAIVSANVQVELEQVQYDTLVDFVFNTSLWSLQKWILPALNCGDYDAIPKQLEAQAKWYCANNSEAKKNPVLCKGVTHRRNAEAAKWRQGRHNTECPPDKTCNHNTGQCECAGCAGAYENTPGDLGPCADPSALTFNFDPNNCGGCGHVCTSCPTDNGYPCQYGSCVCG